MISVITPGVVKVDYGPLQMTISGQNEGGPMTEAAGKAAYQAMKVLTQLAAYRQAAASPQPDIIDKDSFPQVLRQMIAAVKGSGDVTLTPMAAVAGTIADLTADWLTAEGATKVIVNNGGDIAIRLAGSQKTAVGVAPAIGRKATHRLNLTAGSGIKGVATSGLGGRSFTKGIAAAAVVAAKSASLADACATSLGNATYVEHPAVKTAWAEELDPNTDIRGHRVVQEIGLLPQAVIEQALMGGWTRAAELVKQGLIVGAAVFVQQQMIMIPEDFLMKIE
jgi:ApbE superfamily uncharacterized protein (UPF0280 family)